MAVRSARVQTAVISLLTDQLSDALGVEAHIDQVDFRFLRTLDLQGVFLSDQMGDTLLYVPTLSVSFDPFALDDNRLRFPSVELQQPYISVWQDSSVNSMEFLLRAFSTPDSLRTPLPMPISIENIAIRDARIRYHHLPSSHDLRLTNIDATVHLPFISNDSLAASIEQLRLHAYLRDIDALVSAEFHGDFDSVFADRLQVTYRGERLLLGSMQLRDPLHLSLTHLLIDCQDLYCSQPVLSCLLSDFYHRPVSLPRELRQLGDVHYRGFLSGSLDTLHLHGAFTSRLGSVTTCGFLSADTTFRDIRFRGEVSTRRFCLGKLLPGSQIGTIAFSTTCTAHYVAERPLDAQGEIHISSLQYRNYTYRHIRSRGTLHNQQYRGRVDIADPNLTLGVSGTVDFSGDYPFADIALQMEHLRLGQLHLLSDCQDEDARCAAHLHFTTASDEDDPQWVDRLNGSLTFDSICLTNYGAEATFRTFDLRFSADRTQTSLRLISDYLNAGISGDFEWSTLPLTMQSFFHKLFPHFVATPRQYSDINDVDFYFYFKNLSDLTALRRKPRRIPYTPTVKGYIHESSHSYSLQAYVPGIEKRNSALQDITLSLYQQNNQADLLLSLMRRTLDLDSTQLRLGDIAVHFAAKACHDSVHTDLAFGNIERYHDDAHIRVDARLDRYRQRPLISLNVLPSRFYLQDTLWTLADSHIEYCAADTALTVSDFCMSVPSRTRSLSVEGIASTRLRDSIRFSLKDFSLGTFMRYLNLDKAIAVGGDVSGWATLYALFAEPVFEANLHVPNAQFNHTPLGDLHATASVDHQTHHVSVEAAASEGERVLTSLTGNVQPENRYWELFIHTDSTDMALLNFWTSSFLHEVEGRAFGDIHVFGGRMKTYVTGDLYAQNAALTVPFTGARYFFSDSVHLDTASISFPSVHLRDAYGHTGRLHGAVFHDRFRSFSYAFDASFRNLMAINRPYSSQESFYGQAFATGDLHLAGDDKGTSVTVNATTCPSTDIYLCVGTASSASDDSFVTFVSTPSSASVRAHRRDTLPDTPSSSSRFSTTLSVAVTPDAQLHLTLNPHTGDGIVGRGEGDMRLTYDGATRDMSLFGTYTIRSGMFSYAVGNLIRKSFTISDGSSLSWSGNLVAPVLDVHAVYRLTANLRDLFGSDASLLTTNRTSVPVECLMSVSERMTNPVLSFGIRLPQSDETLSAQVRSIINSEEMLMREVVHLLVFNCFFTPEYLATSYSRSSDAYSLLSSTVTGQINSWLSRLTDVVSVGFNFRSDGEGSAASQEYETQFQINPVNRLTIMGNFGYRYNDLSNRPFFGDVDIEYGLTRDNQLKAHAFTHTVDKYSLKQAATVQGVGLLFRHDFNWGDARRKRQLKKQQQQEGD